MALLAVTTDHVAYEHEQDWTELDRMSRAEVRALHRKLHVEKKDWGHTHLYN